MNLFSCRCLSLRLCHFIGLVFTVILLAQPDRYAYASASKVTLYPIPPEVSSSHFRVSLNGRSTNVLHAATGHYLLSFETNGPVTVSVTASDPSYWDVASRFVRCVLEFAQCAVERQ